MLNRSPIRSRFESECDNCLEKVTTIRSDDAQKLFPEIMEKTLNESNNVFKTMPVLEYIAQMRLVKWACDTFVRPIEFLLVISKNILDWLQTISEHDIVMERLEYLAKSFLFSFDKQKNMYCATMSCQMAITDVSLRNNQTQEFHFFTNRSPEKREQRKLISNLSDQALKELQILKRHDQKKKQRSREKARASESSSVASSDSMSLHLSPSTSRVVYDPDSFEHVVNYTEEHESLLSYYYHDDNNELQICNIYSLDQPNSSHSCHRTSDSPKAFCRR
ncbi:hypothetical protein L596_003990 [Steinernema carpocapsae]|uniref:Uncharacterized protein n=1 Tax=Steinernema carpocapsae TaxID=34508 RepID=A0A4U8UYF3_STECR|nr:hypothetical protein L596_003990 [Steinernema carpocapsae]